jgi:drug/metabolite transporter (DMT)-like permease
VSRSFTADLLLIGCSLIWGATFVIVKGALADASVFVFLSLRFLLAAALLVLIFGHTLRGLSLHGFRAGVLIGSFMLGGYAFQTAGLRLTTPSKAAFITGFFIVLVPLLQALFWRRRIGAWMWTGIASAVAGLYLLTVPATGFTQLNRGDLLVLACAFLYAFHVISLEHYSIRYPTGALSLLQVGTTALGTFLAVPLFSILRWDPAWVVWTPKLIAAIIVTGVLATALAFSAQTWAQQYTTATHAAIIFTLEPVFAALISFTFYDERLGWRGLLGSGLILAGILLAEVMGPKRPMPESA